MSLFLAFKSFPIDFDSTVCGVWVGMLEPVGVEIYDQQVTMLRFPSLCRDKCSSKELEKVFINSVSYLERSPCFLGGRLIKYLVGFWSYLEKDNKLSY